MVDVQDEIELIEKVLLHPAGFIIDMFGGLLSVQPTEHEAFGVMYDPDYTDGARPEQQYWFHSAREAAEMFVELRIRYQIGLDMEGEKDG